MITRVEVTFSDGSKKHQDFTISWIAKDAEDALNALKDRPHSLIKEVTSCVIQ